MLRLAMTSAALAGVGMVLAIAPPGVLAAACTHIQVVYTGVNITSPSTCAQTGFS